VTAKPPPRPEPIRPVVNLPDLSKLSRFELDWIAFRATVEIPEDGFYALNKRKQLFGQEDL
jgi:hypothetical protein